MADPLVQEWHSRGLDSVVSDREVAAVNDWLSTNKTFQIMRDNPAHGVNILGGCFGMQFNKGQPGKQHQMTHESCCYYLPTTEKDRL